MHATATAKDYGNLRYAARRSSIGGQNLLPFRHIILCLSCPIAICEVRIAERTNFQHYGCPKPAVTKIETSNFSDTLRTITDTLVTVGLTQKCHLCRIILADVFVQYVNYLAYQVPNQPALLVRSNPIALASLFSPRVSNKRGGFCR